MDAQQNLTVKQKAMVEAHCHGIDEFLAKFKESQKLEAVTFIDDRNILGMIYHLKTGDAKSAILKYLVSYDEIFEIFTLVWKSRVKANISTFLNSQTLWTFSYSISNLTDCSEELCYAFGEKGLLTLLFHDLKTGTLGDRHISYALTIIYNCCWKVSENRVICQEFVDTLQECSQSKNPEIQADAFLALSYIVDKSEVHKISLNEPCLKFLLLTLKSAMSEPGRRFHGYSTLEVLQGLNQLAINDCNKLLIVKLSGIDVLERILMEEGSSNEEKRWAARGIWQLAFKEENKVKIHQRTTLLNALEKIKETTEDYDIKDACSGALFVINDVLDIDDEFKGHIPTRGDGGHSSVKNEVSSGHVEGHIMISYQHASQERMLQVKCHLEESGYNVWMDVDKMKGDILDSMAKAVQRASVVLVCMSHKFKESQHCRTEATYAYTLKKDIIPLMLQDQFTPEDWLGALMGMKKYYPMFSDDLMRQCLPDLVSELSDRGKREKLDLVLPLDDEVTGASNPTSHAQRQRDGTAEDAVDCSGGNKDDKPTGNGDEGNSRSQTTVDLGKWDEKKAGEWLRSYGIDTSKDSSKKVDGTRLKQIKKLLNLAPEFCLKSLKDELGLCLWDVLALVDALEKL
ncbi:uncharacterized protein LOC115926145 [Strongylocentrotus purpuratus]|uniref:TIR domain-containing protein n=1 Tax=Strongylocentrotus purpuratus TaxID=7668 RepID=A0A7M7P7U0_STRPU|nr:uncharacterized protein LOC115926145 [Strongylocentrotus purpuratus]|eukprot:XP_011666614.1 PREDICTED: uncharacterized protein LOC105439383 [Strongylocentrotus purpuratus]